jgi:hypothetical protein
MVQEMVSTNGCDGQLMIRVVMRRGQQGEQCGLCGDEMAAWGT